MLNNFQTMRAVGVAGVAIFAAGVAQAQSVPPPVPPSGQSAATGSASQTKDARENTGLTDIVVTAQRREQRLQDVPVSVVALSSAALARANITVATDLPKLAPSLVINQASGVVLPFLRGIGNPTTVVGNESSVAVYVDGIYLSRLAPAYLEFSDVERIEVLSGPQGTLFGRNASAGLINIITREPSNTPELTADVGYANYDTRTARLYATGPITDNLAASVSGVFANQRNGWGKNVTTGQDFGGLDNHKAVRGKLKFTPSERTTIVVSGEYLNGTTDVGIPGNGFPGTTLGSKLIVPVQPLSPVGFYDTRDTFNGYTHDEAYGFSGRIQQKFDEFIITSLTNYSHANGFTKFDTDFQAANFQQAILNYRTHQFSQELQVSSRPRSPISWIVGAYYLNSLAGYDPTTLSGLQFGVYGPGANSLNIVSQQVIHSYAAYAQATFPIVEHTNLTIGARYTYDQLYANGRQDVLLGAGGSLPVAPYATSKATFQKPTWKASLDHHFNEAIMVYGSYSRGFKDGTYNLLSAITTPVNPEVLDTFELGAKTEFFDRRLRVNLALFLNKLKDPQVQVFENNLASVENACCATSKGFEFQVEGQLSERLTLRATGTLLDAYYTGFKNAPFTSTNPNPPYGNFPYSQFDATGRDLPRAPNTAITGGASYWIPMGSGKTSFDVNYAYNGGYYFSVIQQVHQGAYGLLDARVKFATRSDRWSVALWGKNITDERYSIYAPEQGGYTGVPNAVGAPRTYGITLGIKM